jgi:hypothetical protein
MRARISVVQGMALAAVVFGSQAQAGSWRQIETALSHIPTAAGSSALDRMRACKFLIDTRSSWMELAASDHPNIGARRGDTIVEVFFEAPRVPGDDFRLNDLVARWVIRGGRPTPESGWASNIQSKRPPIGSDRWENC